MNQRQQLIALAAALLVATIVSSTEAFQSAATTNNALFTSHYNPTKSFVSKRIIPSNNSINNRHNTHTTQLFVSAEIDLDTIKADEARAKAIAQKNAQLPKTNNAPNNNNDQQQGITNSNDKEWKFFDTARLHVTAGSGGNGCVAFRREKGEAMGGPNGGRGGSGGTVYFIADSSLNTLAGLRNKIHVKAKHGKNGIGKNKDGQHGNDAYVRVPCGTIRWKGNAAFMTHRRTAPKFCEHGEPGSERWLSVELRLVADVGFWSTLLSSASAAKPKIANYPFTTIVPNLGVCDLGEESSGLVLCDIPGLIEGAAQGLDLDFIFETCSAVEDPIGDFNILNKELAMYDDKLGTKPQVVVLNKCDVSEVKEQQDELVDKLRLAAGHSRVMTISAATTENCKELMARLKKFVEAEKKKAIEEDLFDDDVLVAEVDFSKAALDSDSDDFEIISDPAYPGQWRVKGEYIEQIAKMTHWEYPEAVERFGRQLKALGIEDELQARGAFDGDLVMIDEYDFDFNPGLTNPYIPQELLEKDAAYEEKENKEHMRAMLLSNDDDEGEEEEWRPFSKGGYMDMDKDEIVEFNDDGDWDLLEDDYDLSPEMLDGDEFWTS
ncbi:ribosome-associated GTPase, OBG family [Skeletonema marinoi]|uniref:Ribosome-associated GTPase, OBG family n=1 Tax=Skeletonema marinoi TaxID=267567 RepID=A0AAD8XSK6_9STRA|nr:ribosome-associated GTPase, OBG family [Skeletonema marinoi]